MRLLAAGIILISEYGWKVLFEDNYNYWRYRIIVSFSILSAFLLLFCPSVLL